MYIYLQYKDTLYKIGEGKCWSFNLGKTKQSRLKKLTKTPCREAKDVKLIKEKFWEHSLSKYGY